MVKSLSFVLIFLFFSAHVAAQSFRVKNTNVCFHNAGTFIERVACDEGGPSNLKVYFPSVEHELILIDSVRSPESEVWYSHIERVCIESTSHAERIVDC